MCGTEEQLESLAGELPSELRVAEPALGGCKEGELWEEGPARAQALRGVGIKAC